MNSPDYENPHQIMAWLDSTAVMLDKLVPIVSEHPDIPAERRGEAARKLNMARRLIDHAYSCIEGC